MTSTVTPNFTRHDPPPRRLSVSEYHQMIDAGIVKSGEPYELIDGCLIFKDRSARAEDRMAIGQGHLWAVNKLARIGRGLDPFGCFMQTQGPVVTSDFDEPEPDGAILIGTEDDYKINKPRAIDTTSVIEVSDSSLGDDREGKQAAYANSGIGQYVIVNLVDRAVEVYTQPEVGKGRYGRTTTLHSGEFVELSLPKGQTLRVAVEEMLP